MSVTGFLIGLGLSLLAAAIVAGPLLRRERLSASSRRHQRERVEAYYERALINIRDLDEDFATGKVNADDYRRERDVWAQRGIRLLRVRDQLADEATAPLDGAEDERIDQAIEAAVAAYRESLPAGAGEPAERDAS